MALLPAPPAQKPARRFSLQPRAPVREARHNCLALRQNPFAVAAQSKAEMPFSLSQKGSGKKCRGGQLTASLSTRCFPFRRLHLRTHPDFVTFSPRAGAEVHNNLDDIRAGGTVVVG